MAVNIPGIVFIYPNSLWALNTGCLRCIGVTTEEYYDAALIDINFKYFEDIITRDKYFEIRETIYTWSTGEYSLRHADIREYPELCLYYAVFWCRTNLVEDLIFNYLVPVVSKRYKLSLLSIASLNNDLETLKVVIAGAEQQLKRNNG